MYYFKQQWRIRLVFQRAFNKHFNQFVQHVKTKVVK